MRKTIFDHEAIVVDLKAHIGTYAQIAVKHGCHRDTVADIAAKYKVQYGTRGLKHFWKFTEGTPDLAYIIGIYLTDGCLTIRPNKKPGQFTVVSTSPGLLDQISLALDSCGLPHSRRPVKDDRPIAKNPQEKICCSVSLFARWLKDVCAGKDIIPQYLFDSPVKDRVAFVGAVIDGDGSVKKSRGIMVTGTKEYLKQLPDLLLSVNIRTTGYKIEKILPSGKLLGRVSINRATFVSAGGRCAVKKKQYRLTHPPERCICPICGEIAMCLPKCRSCKSCWIKSIMHDHLAIVDDLRSQKFNNYSEIAYKHGCSQSTVNRVARKFNLQRSYQHSKKGN